jgi:Ser/Thr protein kinase RdoA (MazF antagonist)
MVCGVSGAGAVAVVSTSMTTTEAGLAAFDHVARGDAAPDWVALGIQRAWGLPTSVSVALIVLSENVTFLVSDGGVHTMVVRLGRPGYAESTDHVRSELVWVEALQRDAGVPTPSPVRGADGDFVQFLLDGSGATWSAVAFEFVAGEILEDRADYADHFGEIGRITAGLHGHARGWTPPGSFRRFSWELTDMVGADARWGDWRGAAVPTDAGVLGAADLAMLERAESAAFAALSSAGVDHSPEHWGLIHGDLRPSNVMTQDGSSLAVIDFDDCGYGYYLYDFGAALTFYEHRPEALRMAASWLDGYRSVTPLSSADLSVAAALSMLRRLTMLGWATTHRADALPADLWEENLPGTVEVGARYLADPLWMVRGA